MAETNPPSEGGIPLEKAVQLRDELDRLISASGGKAFSTGRRGLFSSFPITAGPLFFCLVALHALFLASVEPNGYGVLGVSIVTAAIVGAGLNSYLRNRSAIATLREDIAGDLADLDRLEDRIRARRK